MRAESVTLHGASISAAVRERVVAAVATQRTLEDVVRWTFAQRPTRRIENVLVQDEYTHDVVVEFDGEHYLVYDTT
ncbi:MAG: hypothetical protein U0271_17180 [Polyangiaceae bacterium]